MPERKPAPANEQQTTIAAIAAAMFVANNSAQTKSGISPETPSRAASEWKKTGRTEALR